MSIETQIPIYGIFKSGTVDGTLVDDYAVIGGYHTVQTIAERDALLYSPSSKYGMAVYVTDVETLYILQSDNTWKEYDLDRNAIIRAKPSIVPISGLTVGTLALVSVNPSAEFEELVCAYIVSISNDVAELEYFGVVKPSNMPSGCNLGDKIYIDNHGTLTTSISTSGKYKYIGNVVVDSNNELAVFISGGQENYNVIV